MNKSELVLEQMGRDDQIRMLEWISPIPYTSHHNRLKESRTRDTCEWLLGHEKFHAWEKARTSMVLWLQGTREYYAFNIFPCLPLTSGSRCW